MNVSRFHTRPVYQSFPININLELDKIAELSMAPSIAEYKDYMKEAMF